VAAAPGSGNDCLAAIAPLYANSEREILHANRFKDMKRLINGVAIGLLALLLMVAGLFVSRVIWLQFNHHYKSMPQGWFHGRISLKANNNLAAL